MEVNKTKYFSYYWWFHTFKENEADILGVFFSDETWFLLSSYVNLIFKDAIVKNTYQDIIAKFTSLLDKECDCQ
jgi:hypothetical protein